jgi:hypothetical protein
MSRTSRTSSFLIAGCGWLLLSLAAVGCKQGIGERCEVTSDCVRGTCEITNGSDPLNKTCCEVGSQCQTLVPDSGGTNDTRAADTISEHLTDVPGETSSDSAAEVGVEVGMEVGSEAGPEVSADAGTSDAPMSTSAGDGAMSEARAD